MIRVIARRSLKQRRCDTCNERIASGDRYLAHVASPHHGDLGNPTWWRLAECAACATRYGRSWMVAS